MQPFERNRRVHAARNAMDRIGYQILNERKAALSSEQKVSDRDVLSLLVKANTAADPSHRLSDEDVLARQQSFLPCICMSIFTNDILQRSPRS